MSLWVDPHRIIWIWRVTWGSASLGGLSLTPHRKGGQGVSVSEWHFCLRVACLSRERGLTPFKRILLFPPQKPALGCTVPFLWHHSEGLWALCKEWIIGGAELAELMREAKRWPCFQETPPQATWGRHTAVFLSHSAGFCTRQIPKKAVESISELSN